MKRIRRLCAIKIGAREEIRVYCGEIPPDESHRRQHFEALELLSAVCEKYDGEKNLRIRRDENGKPQLIHPTMHMNLAHCKGLVVCAVGYRAVGVDAEFPRPIRDSLISRICSPKEASAISAAKQKDLMFSRLWTLKEAYGKWEGGGIRLPLSELSFSLSEDSIVFDHPDQDNVSFFQLMLTETENSNLPAAVSVCCGKIGQPFRIESPYDVIASRP